MVTLVLAPHSPVLQGGATNQAYTATTGIPLPPVAAAATTWQDIYDVIFAVLAV